MFWFPIADPVPGRACQARGAAAWTSWQQTARMADNKSSACTRARALCLGAPSVGELLARRNLKIGSDLLISQRSPAKAALGEKTARCTKCARWQACSTLKNGSRFEICTCWASPLTLGQPSQCSRFGDFELRNFRGLHAASCRWLQLLLLLPIPRRAQTVSVGWKCTRPSAKKREKNSDDRTAWPAC